MAPKEKPVAKRIKENQLGILLTILGLIQGLAFSRLMILSFDALRNTSYSLSTLTIGLHSVLCFLIIIRLFETIFLGYMDYDDVIFDFYVIIYIFIIGGFEYWLIETFIDFSVPKFYSKIIFLGILTFVGYLFSTIRIASKKHREKIFSNHSTYMRELLLQLINLTIPVILIIISILILKRVITDEVSYIVCSLFISSLIIVNIITSWVLTINGPKVEEPWGYNPGHNTTLLAEKRSVDNNITVQKATDNDSLQISELFLFSFPYVFRDTFATKDKNIIRILSRMILFNDGNNIYGYRNISVARDITGKIIGFITLSVSNNSSLIQNLKFGLYTLTLVFFHTGLMGLPVFLKNILRNKNARPIISEEELYIGYIGVTSPYQKNGVGSLLLEHARMEAINTKKKSLGLDVRSDNEEALKLFLKFGFKEIRRFDDHAFNKPERIYMIKELDQFNDTNLASAHAI